jgi:hypothetical protein
MISFASGLVCTWPAWRMRIMCLVYSALPSTRLLPCATMKGWKPSRQRPRSTSMVGCRCSARNGWRACQRRRWTGPHGASGLRQGVSLYTTWVLRAKRVARVGVWFMVSSLGNVLSSGEARWRPAALGPQALALSAVLRGGVDLAGAGWLGSCRMRLASASSLLSR